MINSFKCEHCRYTSNRLYNLQRHMVLKHDNVDIQSNQPRPIDDSNERNHSQYDENHSPNVENHSHDEEIQNPNVENVTGHKCHTCYKTFASQRYLQKHISDGKCKRVSSPFECEKCHVIFSCQPAKSKHRKICKGLTKDTLSYPAPSTIINNNTNNTNNSNNTINNNGNNYIVINNFGQENLSHVTPEFIQKCLQGLNKGVCDYIEKVNFNPHVPENHNIRYEDNKSVRVKDGGNWRLRHIESAIQNLITKRCNELQTHYEDNEELMHTDEIMHYNIIRDHLQYLIGGVKKEMKPVYDQIVYLLKELETLYKTE